MQGSLKSDRSLERSERALWGCVRRRSRGALPLLAVILLSGCEFQRIKQLEERAQEARSEIEVELQRRAELVPSLLETVQENAVVSETLADRVGEARVRLIEAVRAGDLANMERASEALSEALDGLLATAAGAPDLRGNAGFGLLRSELEGTRQRITTAGDRYNEAARRYNDYISNFPQSLTAKVIGAEKLQIFRGPEEPVSTSFSDG